MKSWAWAAVGLLCGAGMVVGSACGGSDTGTGGSNAGGGGGNGGTASTVTSNPTMSTASSTGGGTPGDCGGFPAQLITACSSCVSDSCCTQAKACDTGTDCANLFACIAGGMTAVSDCNKMFPKGVDVLNTLASCMNTKCSDTTKCGGFCPGNTIGYNNTQLADCNSCVNASCCSEYGKLTDELNNSTDPNCMSGGDSSMCPPLAQLNACEQDISGANCTDADAKAAAACESSKCSDTCPQFICDSGIIQTGAGAAACTSCLTTNCCEEFSGSMCADSAQQAACTTWLADFNGCGTDSGACNGDASAKAAFDCQTTNCNTECGGGSGGSGGGN